MRRADNGIDRAGIAAMKAADAGSFVNDCDRRLDVSGERQCFPAQ
jgi:hypothetical protein